MAQNNAINNRSSTLVVDNTLTVTAGNITATLGDVDITAGNINIPNTNTGGSQGRIIASGVTIVSTYPGGSGNFFAGPGVANTVVTLTGTLNTVVGGVAGISLTSGQDNSGFGSSSLSALTTGNNNAACGTSSLTNLTTGVNNIAIGLNSGSAYTSSESSNISIGNAGIISESNVLRLGTNGSGAGQQNKCFIAGIDGVNVGSVARVVTEASNQLGTAVITAGTGITVTPGANTITISTTGTTTLTVTSVNHGASPYTVLTTDDFLAVDVSGGVVTIKLPNAPTTGRVWYIKDSTGSAFTSNITVTTVGGAVNIDGATSYTMNTNYAAISVIFDGTAYEVF